MRVYVLSWDDSSQILVELSLVLLLHTPMTKKAEKMLYYIVS